MPAAAKNGLDKLHGGLLFGEGVWAPRVLWSVRVGLLLCLRWGMPVQCSGSACGMWVVCRHGASSNPGTRILGVASYCCVFFVPLLRGVAAPLARYGGWVVSACRRCRSIAI